MMMHPQKYFRYSTLFDSIYKIKKKLVWYVTFHLVLNRVIYCTVYAFQVTYSPELSDNTYSDTLEWTVKTPGLIKCFANNSEGSSSETVSLFITGKLYF
jgi:hypothetical protein